MTEYFELSEMQTALLNALEETDTILMEDQRVDPPRYTLLHEGRPDMPVTLTEQECEMLVETHFLYALNSVAWPGGDTIFAFYDLKPDSADDDEIPF